jgi:hypothetical protein
MPRRQHQVKQSYRDDDTRPGETNGPEASADIPNIKREFILTQSADETLYDTVRLFSKTTGAKLTNSHFLRILLKGIAYAMPQLEREASKLGKLKRPNNARENQAEREGYEQKIAEAVVAAMRSCPPFDTPGNRRRPKGPGKR